jgi:excisionase family DNA binding protein
VFDSTRMGLGPPKGAEPSRLVEPLLTKAQTAKLLAVCPRTVDNMIADGRLKLVKLGTAARIDPRDLRAFIDAAK